MGIADLGEEYRVTTGLRGFDELPPHSRGSGNSVWSPGNHSLRFRWSGSGDIPWRYGLSGIVTYGVPHPPSSLQRLFPYLRLPMLFRLWHSIPLLFSLATLPAIAQVTPDNSLNTQVDLQNNVFNVTGGTTSGGNLFHSFSEFSIPQGGGAFFNHAPDLQRVISRVTGGNVSDIQGSIRSLGSADFFLINPAGIVFGESAALNVGGSFVATTSDRLLFADGIAFDATTATPPPLLTMSVPAGLQTGINPGSIINRSRTPDAMGEVRGLQVQPAQSLVLLGGEIQMEGGFLSSVSGPVSVGSVGGNSTVGLSATAAGVSLDYSGVTAFGNITLSNQGGIDTSGDRGGAIHLEGQQILLRGASLVANNFGAEDGSDVTINSSESLVLTGIPDETENLIQVETSGIGTGGSIDIMSPVIEVDANSSIVANTSDQGQGGHITINTDQITVLGEIRTDLQGVGAAGNLTLSAETVIVDGGGLLAVTNGSGNAGNLTISAAEVSVDNGGVIFADALADGNAGILSVVVQRLIITNGAQIGTGSITGGSGNAGSTNIQASESIRVFGGFLEEDPAFPGEIFFVPAGIFSDAQRDSTGNGGTLNIETPLLELFEGGDISARTSGTGNGGSVVIHANRIDINGSGGSGLWSPRITSNVTIDGSGNGGNIEIVTNQLNVSDGGFISTSSRGLGNAGNISIQAQDIKVEGIFPAIPLADDSFFDPPLPSEISSLSDNEFSAGSVTITTDTLTIADGGLVSVSGLGSGDAGNLTITADSIRLDNQGRVEAEVMAGNQGDIDLTTKLLFLRNGSNITTNASEQANGGNISLTTVNLAALNGGNITANAVQGQGGDIVISTQGLFFANESQISASSQFGLDGLVNLNTPELDGNLEFIQLPDNPTEASEKLAPGCAASDNSFISSGRGGIVLDPSWQVGSDRSWNDVRDLSSFRGIGRLTASPDPSEAIAQGPKTEPEMLLEATGWHQLVSSTTGNLASRATGSTSEGANIPTPIHNWCHRQS